MDVYVQGCSIRVQRHIFHCGMLSHISEVAGGRDDYLFEVPQSVCQDIHANLRFNFHGVIIDNLKPNATNTGPSLTIAGTVDSYGNCHGVPYVEGSRVFEKETVVTAIVTITLSDYYAPVDLINNKISLKSGLSCPFGTGTCTDFEQGQVFWASVKIEECNRHYFDILYQGQGNFILAPDSTRTQNDTYLTVQSEQRVFALKLTKQSLVCGQTIWETENPSVLIWIDSGLGFYFERQPLNPKSIDLNLQISSLLMFSELGTKTSLQNLHLYSVYKRCQLERQNLEQKLLMARISPTNAAQLLMQEAGYIATLAGESAFIMKCRPVFVKLRKANACYDQLPIYYGNSSLFMQAVTRTITKHAIEVECNPIVAPIFRVEGKWIKLAPDVSVVEGLEKLTPHNDNAISFDHIADFNQGGIYTTKEMQSLTRVFNFPQERDAIANIIAMRIAGHNVTLQGYNTAYLFSPEQFQKLAESFFGKIWTLVSDFGIFSSGIIGAYLLLRVLKYLFCIILNAIAIFQTIGPHPYLLASVWTTLTNLILHRQQHRRTEQIIELTRQETSKLENETLNADISAPNQVMSSAPHSSLVYVPLPNTPVYPGYQA